jgi:hypothetical protein
MQPIRTRLPGIVTLTRVERSISFTSSGSGRSAGKWSRISFRKAESARETSETAIEDVLGRRGRRRLDQLTVRCHVGERAIKPIELDLAGL